MWNMRPPEPRPSPGFCPGCQRRLGGGAHSRLAKGVHADCLDERVVFIKTKKVGYLIGQRGRTIFNFENSSGAKIDILSPNSRDDETPVQITGTANNVSSALRKILDLFSLDNYSSSERWDQEKNVRQLPDGVVGNEVLIVPAEVGYRFMDFGKSRIEEISGTKIIVCPENDETGCDFIINVVGTAESNGKALTMIENRMRTFADSKDAELAQGVGCSKTVSRKRSRTESEVSSMSENNNLYELTRMSDCLTVDSLSLACISLQPLCKKYNVSVEIEQLTKEDGVANQQVVITGHKECVGQAKFELTDATDRIKREAKRSGCKRLRISPSKGHEFRSEFCSL